MSINWKKRVKSRIISKGGRKGLTLVKWEPQGLDCF